MVDAIERYRASYRQEVIPHRYDGKGNVRSNMALCLLLIAGTAFGMGRPGLQELAALVAGLLVFNFFEYGVHRWVSHKKRPLLRRLYQRHTGEHHGFFNETRMTSPLLEDYHVTIMPSSTIAGYFVAFVAVLGIPLGLAFDAEVACGFALGIALSLLQLDLLHFYYHLESEAWLCRVLDRFSYMRLLKRIHCIHHDKRQMNHCGFNITHPLFDWLLRTLPKHEASHGSR